MRRREFLQLAGSASAGALVSYASLVSIASDAAATGIVVKSTLNGTVSVTNSIMFPEQAEWIGISGWISPDGPVDVLHVMLERRPAAPWSYPEMEFPRLQPGRGYRLRLMNGTSSAIPVHLNGRRVELAHYSVVEADLIARVQTLL